ncbi:MAG: hypothetical protein LQ351_003919 [Letrouitia transgressa]|nr:MAG: hypothetical protein LQ351_003919 [Letrouitia transgressa]
MPDPASLPLELLDKILDTVLRRIAKVGIHEYTIKYLYAFSLFNRTWHARITPRLYSHWTYRGGEHTILHLWKFLRTIVSNDRLASLVRSLDIQRWDLYPIYPGMVCRYDDFPAEDVRLVCKALHLADLAAMKRIMLQALNQNDRKPLIMALLMTYLPCLTKLNVAVQEIDECFTQVLILALHNKGNDQTKRRAFQNLREASFNPPRAESNCPILYDENLWPLYCLPNIRKLSISNLTSEGVEDHHPDNLARTSRITDLTLAYWERSRFTLAKAQTLLTMPRTLVNLSLYFNDENLTSSPTNPKSVSNAELWKILVSYQNSIEYLDIYRTSRVGPPVRNTKNSHMGLLHDFNHLKILRIQPYILLGGYRGGERASFRLGDTLPQALKSLTVYGDLQLLGEFNFNDQHLANNREIERQLIEVVYGRQFTQLKSIVLEDVDVRARNPTNLVDLPRQALEQACEDMNVRLDLEKSPYLPKGGLNCPIEPHEDEVQD